MKCQFLISGVLSLSVFFFVFCTRVTPEKYYKRYPPIKSTLDSLQGIWINEDDSYNQIIISGRYWNDKYTSPTIILNDTYRIYFSDTAVNVNNFLNARIDTSSLSGQYIITVRQSDNSMDCSYLLGFHQDNLDTTFSIRPATGFWRASSVQLFKKTH